MKQSNNTSILFFGSTADSLIILKKLFEAEWNIVAVVTQPPRPIGRKQILTPTPTEVWAKEHTITVLSFSTDTKQSILYENETAVINSLSTLQADLLISASYGQKIPTQTISQAKYGGVNVHPSLLPRWRGADPIPWTILSGDNQTGVTLVTLSEHMDEGKIIAQKKIPLTREDTHIPLREKLFVLGAKLLTSTLPEYLNGSIHGQPQNPAHATFARRLTRQDGYIPWEIIEKAMKGENFALESLPKFFQQWTDLPIEPLNRGALLVDRAIRALSPWPGVWTEVKINGEKNRLKILSAHSHQQEGKELLIVEEVQREGKTPVPFQTFSKTLLQTSGESE